MAGVTLTSSWPRPTRTRPIVIIGCGGIVNDGHLPAYRKAGFPVAGVYDVDRYRAVATATRWGIDAVYDSLAEAAAQAGVVFDVATQPQFVPDVLRGLPDQAVALLQKPMGLDLAHAQVIRDVCAAKRITAAVNFQLRFAPMMLAVSDAQMRGLLGSVVNVDVRLNLRTPWELFPFLQRSARVEILYHSIHHIDLVRHLMGDPTGAYARSVRHPQREGLTSSSSSIILDYGPTRRACLSLNHDYFFGPRHEEATVLVEGTDGAMRVTLGLLLNYPKGLPETVEFCPRGGEWSAVPINGQWFPDGFVGTMGNLQRFIHGEDPVLISRLDDAIRTMAVVEACYTSDESGATPIPAM
jgi:predicted dehydrogenase